MLPEESPNPTESTTSTVSDASDDIQTPVVSPIHRGSKRAATPFDFASLKRAKSDVSMLSAGSLDSSPDSEDPDNDASAPLPNAVIAVPIAAITVPITTITVPITTIPVPITAIPVPIATIAADIVVPNAAIAASKAPATLKRSTSKVFMALDPAAPTNTAFPAKLKFAPLGDKEDVKLVTWNVSGLRAALKKGFQQYIEAEDPDVVCLQEVKVNAPVPTLGGAKYPHKYWAFEDKKGYAGTAVLSKYKPLNVIYGLPGCESDSAARVITLEFATLYLVACYVPNAGQNLSRLGERSVFDKYMEKWLRGLEEKGKGVVWTGDLNVAHKEVDLAKPKGNEKTAGFTPQERMAFSRILTGSPNYRAALPEQPLMIDAWRHLHPDVVGRFTYYSYRFQCRTKGIGWRIDYFIVSPKLVNRIAACEIRDECYGASDHIPLVCVVKGGL